MRARSTIIAIALIASVAPVGAIADHTPVHQDRSVDPVIMKGSQFPQWSAGADPTLREPGVPTNYETADVQGMLPEQLRSECYDPGSNEWDPNDTGDHNCYQSSRLPRNPLQGAPVEQLLGYRWTGEGFEQIPFQVDERFTRYLSNNVSGFAFYSTVDQHNTYAFDREGFRFTDNDPDDVCKPRPRAERDGSRPATTPDPVVGLDDDDELVFMYRDAAEQAPPGSTLPDGIEQAVEIAVTDPSNPEHVAFAYVMLAVEDGPEPAFGAENSPYIRYQRDAGPTRLGADLFVFSESSYDGYGLAPHGPICDAATGEPIVDENGDYVIRQRRPLDTAWITTPRYSFRYEGRWLMTELHVSSDEEGDWSYGPDIIDRWKARAFQQDPSSETPCCGYEEEDTNWGGSSILMGERVGPVRTIRETWGADSSTNNARREIFYRDLFVWGDALRVHVIPPLDGIYAQWDYNAGMVSTYYNPTVPDGVPIDGQNDEVFGNLDDPCNPWYDGRGAQDDEDYRALYRSAGICELSEYHQSIDLPDPTLSGVQALQWEQIAGDNGTIVARTVIRDHTPGGDAQSFLTVPYYRDDSCFDDGTGTDPGPRRRERSSQETRTYRLPGSDVNIDRTCWQPDDPIDVGFTAGVDERGLGDEFGDERYFQGSIGTHGVHILLIADSDNAATTVPLTEIDSEQRVVVLPPTLVNVGERYGRFLEFPLTTVARLYS
ncbi:MAG TPA: hypothetical protein VGB52_01610 [Actinomycetota bacterium]